MRKRNLVLAACAALAVGALGIGSSEAVAQCGYGGGVYGGGYGGGFGYSNYAYPRSSVSIGVGFSNYPRYGYNSFTTGRGHYDYHPTTLYRHRNHYHVQPAHYDYHRGRHHRHYRH